MRFGVIGVPSNSAGRRDGVAGAPAALRAAGLIERLREVGDVVDRGDVALPEPASKRDAVSGLIDPGGTAAMVAAVRFEVAAAEADGQFPLVIGGDCPLLLGCLSAVRDAQGPVGLLFVDGHEDAWPPGQSLTGEAADMELGLALGRSTEGLPAGLHDLLPLVDPHHVVVLGPRDAAELEDAGVVSLRDHVRLVPDNELRAADTGAVGIAEARRLRERTERWWLHVDMDVLSTEALVAVDYPQPGGLGWKQLLALTRGGLSVPGCVGWDVTIYNPDLDPGGTFAALIVDYVVASLGPAGEGSR